MNSDRYNLAIVAAVAVVAVIALLVVNDSGLIGNVSSSGAAVSEPSKVNYEFELRSDGETNVRLPKASTGGVPGVETSFWLNRESGGMLSKVAPDNVHTFQDGSVVEWLSTRGHAGGGNRLLETEFLFKNNLCSSDFKIGAKLLPAGRAQFTLTDLSNGRVHKAAGLTKLEGNIAAVFSDLPGHSVKLLSGSERNELEGLTTFKFTFGCN